MLFCFVFIPLCVITIRGTRSNASRPGKKVRAEESQHLLLDNFLFFFLRRHKEAFWMIPIFFATEWSFISRTRFKHNTLISCAWFSFSHGNDNTALMTDTHHIRRTSSDEPSHERTTMTDSPAESSYDTSTRNGRSMSIYGGGTFDNGNWSGTGLPRQVFAHQG